MKPFAFGAGASKYAGAARRRRQSPHRARAGASAGEPAALAPTLVRGIGGEREKVEVVGVLQRLLREVGLGRRERGLEVGYGLALSLKQPRLDLVDQHSAAPSILDGLRGVPETLQWVFQLRDKLDVVAPGDFCHRLRQKFTFQFSNSLLENRLGRFSNGLLKTPNGIGPREVESPHVQMF